MDSHFDGRKEENFVKSLALVVVYNNVVANTWVRNPVVKEALHNHEEKEVLDNHVVKEILDNAKFQELEQDMMILENCDL